MKTISQREARRLKKRVALLEQQEQQRLESWASEWPLGVDIGDDSDEAVRVRVAVKTARRLGHAVVAVVGIDDLLRFIALPLALKEQGS